MSPYDEAMEILRRAQAGEPTAQYPHLSLLLAREQARSPQMQAMLGPAEHQAFAREYVQQSPLLGMLQLGVATPAYSLLKLARGGVGARSPASWDEVFGGYKGILEGLGRK